MITKVCGYCQGRFEVEADKWDKPYCSRSCAQKHRWAKKGKRRTLDTALPPAEKSECEECGYREYPQILQRHHKNCDKKDNRRENLVVLCPTCHVVDHYLNQTGFWAPYKNMKKLA